MSDSAREDLSNQGDPRNHVAGALPQEPPDRWLKAAEIQAAVAALVEAHGQADLTRDQVSAVLDEVRHWAICAELLRLLRENQLVLHAVEDLSYSHESRVIFQASAERG